MYDPRIFLDAHVIFYAHPCSNTGTCQHWLGGGFHGLESRAQRLPSPAFRRRKRGKGVNSRRETQQQKYTTLYHSVRRRRAAGMQNLILWHRSVQGK